MINEKSLITEYTPQELATKRRMLALEYKSNMKELADIQKKKAFEIIKLIDKHSSVAKAERYYAITDDGQKEIELNLYTRGLLETMRAVKTEVDIMSGEAFNQY